MRRELGSRADNDNEREAATRFAGNGSSPELANPRELSGRCPPMLFHRQEITLAGPGERNAFIDAMKHREP